AQAGESFLQRRRFLRQSFGAGAWMLGCKPSELDEHRATPELPAVPPEVSAGPRLVEASVAEAPMIQVPSTIAPELDGEPPEWTLGDESSSPNTVLMFRGGPRHDFYGTGPIAERPELIWRTRLGEARGTRADGSL